MSRFCLDIDHAGELGNREIINLSDATDIESSAGLVEQFSGVIGIGKKLRPGGAFLGNVTVVLLYSTFCCMDFRAGNAFILGILPDFDQIPPFPGDAR